MRQGNIAAIDVGCVTSGQKISLHPFLE